ncbi:MAG: type II toxin-antitoxin system HipA family toxin [Giesbergeria sp.]|nr:type II toxin-antitoxin system HipA family toxin [Giesbergeria sp.]
MMPDPSSTQLAVFFGDQLVGHVFDSAPLSFAYSAEWLARPETAQIAAITPEAGPISSAAVTAFFENLLPEGELRRFIVSSKKASTLFALLREVAGDTAGGFVILPAGQQPERPAYQATTWAALAARLGQPSAAALDLQAPQTRISLSGAQDKAAIALFADGLPQLPLGTSPSTHILKPDIKRLAKVWHSAANETLIMRTAALCGLPTAEVFYEPLTQACVVQRFDRQLRPDGSLGRLMQYDLCQLSAIASDKKYEKEGGPGVAECAQLIRHYSSVPAVDLKNFLAWLFFNLYTGNNDGHAKNLSIYRAPGGGIRLTPFYDLMCTRIYPGLSREFALAIGGEVLPGAMTRGHVEQMAQSMGIRAAFALGIAADMAQRVPVAMEAAITAVQPDLSPGAKTLALRLQSFVRKTTQQMSKRLLSKLVLNV